MVIHSRTHLEDIFSWNTQPLREDNILQHPFSWNKQLLFQFNFHCNVIPVSQIDSKSTLVVLMAWHSIDKPLPEPMIIWGFITSPASVSS